VDRDEQIPHGLGRSKRVLAIAGADKQKEAADAGADHVAVQVLTADRGELPLDEWRELAPALL